MALARGVHTVLVFKHLQFQGDWTRMSLATTIVGYVTNKAGKLVAVAEKPTGQMITYWFSLKPGDEVWVTYGGDAQVHVPALCERSAPGDQIKCR
jgi:hypothetical protein